MNLNIVGECPQEVGDSDWSFRPHAGFFFEHWHFAPYFLQVDFHSLLFTNTDIFTGSDFSD